ncbi:MAG: glycoside hydrolase family 113 [Promethearchaeota archaeon]
MENEKKKKNIIFVLIILGGSLLTFLSSFWYYYSIQQEGTNYEDISFQRGMSFTTWGADSFNSSKAREEILKMKEIDIEWIGVNIWWIQENIDATEIEEGSWSDTAANITALFEFIHLNGMKVFFKPMLDSKDSVWRSYIKASPKWIKEYNRFIKYTAEIAENGSVEVFCIGCEMGNWQVKSNAVRELIKDIRKIFSGDLTYAANHDSFWYIDWWDAVDIIGVDAYFSFTLSYDPTLQDMIDVWNGFYDEFHKFQKKWNKPILFTEIGCQNRDGCNIAPNDNKYSIKQDEKEFQMFYKSLFESKIWTAPWFKGTYWWIWDLREIDEDDDNGFTPQLSIIKSTLQKYYSERRNIIYPSYLVEFIFIIILGSLITVVSSIIFCKCYEATRYLVRKDKQEIITEELTSEVQKNNINQKSITKFIILNGITFGSFIFWAFNYYNHILFNMLYSTITKSVFLGEETIFILIAILLTLISMSAIWIFIQRLFNKEMKFRKEIISVIGITISALIFILEVFFTETIANQFSIRFVLTLQIMILLGSFFTLTFIYGFPRQYAKKLEKKGKKQLIFIISFGILAITAIILILFSYLLQISLRAPAIVIGIVLIFIIPFIYASFPQFSKLTRDKKELIKETSKSRLQMKLIETLVCIYALGYYFGLLRYVDSHTLINFNLSLLPNFFILIGFSLLIAIPMTLGLYSILKLKSPSIGKNLDLEDRDKNEILLFLVKNTMLISIPILISSWLFSAISLELVLILGGIPLALIFIIFFIGSIDSSEIFKENNNWKKMTIYLIIFLTIAFSANGAMVGLLYALTFLTIDDGKIVVEIAFEEKLGFDAIQMIYNIQLLIAIILILIPLILAKYLVPKVNK